MIKWRYQIDIGWNVMLLIWRDQVKKNKKDYDSIYITLRLQPMVNRMLTEASSKTRRSKIKEAIIRLEKSLIEYDLVPSLETQLEKRSSIKKFHGICDVSNS